MHEYIVYVVILSFNSSHRSHHDKAELAVSTEVTQLDTSWNRSICNPSGLITKKFLYYSNVSNFKVSATYELYYSIALF